MKNKRKFFLQIVYLQKYLMWETFTVSFISWLKNKFKVITAIMAGPNNYIYSGYNTFSPINLKYTYVIGNSKNNIGFLVLLYQQFLLLS